MCTVFDLQRPHRIMERIVPAMGAPIPKVRRPLFRKCQVSQSLGSSAIRICVRRFNPDNVLYQHAKTLIPYSTIPIVVRSLMWR